MAYMPHTESDVQEMLATIGAPTVDALFRDIPQELLLKKPLELPALAEHEIVAFFEKAAAENNVPEAGRSFLGAGAYRHYIPAAVKTLMQRGEFVTCYTPYQAEVSQGTLQWIFEFQSHIASLTGLDVANASMYDGATALAEAITMAARHNGRHAAYLPELLHPAYRSVCETFLKEIDIAVKTIPMRADGTTDFAALAAAEDATAIVVQTPNALGSIEDGREARAAADRAGAMLIAVVNPTSLAVLAAPGDYGADIAVGEGQPLGLPLSFGGPYAGFFACRNEHIRKMPGRIVGKTKDRQGNEGYVLTLQTREQHIRRAKATSNICTNQGLFALMMTMYLTFIGREGLVEVAETSMARTRQLVEGMEKLGAKRIATAPYFHEAALELRIPAADFIARMRKEAGILAGWPLQRWYPGWKNAGNALLVNCTEMNAETDVETYLAAAKNVLA